MATGAAIRSEPRLPVIWAEAIAMISRAKTRAQLSRYKARNGMLALLWSERVMERTNDTMGRSEFILMRIDAGDDRWDLDDAIPDPEASRWTTGG
jgi:hypothetical protein